MRHRVTDNRALSDCSDRPWRSGDTGRHPGEGPAQAGERFRPAGLWRRGSYRAAEHRRPLLPENRLPGSERTHRGGGARRPAERMENRYSRRQRRDRCFSIVGGKLFVTRLQDVKTETTIYTLEGRETGRFTYPGIGSGSGCMGGPARRKASIASSPSFSRRRSFATTRRAETRRSLPSQRCPSIRRSMKSRRSSTPRRTARACRCSLPAKRAWSATARHAL